MHDGPGRCGVGEGRGVGFRVGDATEFGDVLEEMGVGGAGGVLQRRGGEVGAVGGEHQPEERRVGGGEGDVAEAGGEDAVGLAGGGRRLVGALGGDEAEEAFGGQRGQDAAGVGEVMRRGGVADPGALGDGAEREALDAALGEFRLGGFEQRRAQVAVVIGAGRRRPEAGSEAVIGCD